MKGLICGTSSDFMAEIYDFRELETYGKRVSCSVHQPGVCTFRCDVELAKSLEFFVITDSMKYRITIKECFAGNFKALIIRKPEPITT